MNLDTLQILIEADAAGLKSQLLRAGDNIKSFISSMNKEEVDWTSILSRTISPAIITGVAATFAMALTNMLQFQNEVATTGQTTADSFSDNSAAVSKEITSLSNKWGVSTGNISNAAGYVYKAFGNTAESSTILSKATAVASTGLMSVQEAAKLMTDVLVAWNINTAPEAASALDRIWDASKNSKLSFSDFTGVLIENGPQMRNIGIKIGDMAIAMEAFSQTTGITGDNIKETFSLITDAATNSGSKLVGILGSNGTVSKELREKGFGSVLTELSNKVTGLGSNAVTVLGSLGVSPNLVSSLQSSNTALQGIQDKITELEKHPVVTIEVSIYDKFSFMQELASAFQAVWNTLRGVFTSFIDGLGILFSGKLPEALKANAENGLYGSILKDAVAGKQMFQSENNPYSVSNLVMSNVYNISEAAKPTSTSKEISDSQKAYLNGQGFKLP
jgi:hypothetical protein